MHQTSSDAAEARAHRGRQGRLGAGGLLGTASLGRGAILGRPVPLLALALLVLVLALLLARARQGLVCQLLLHLEAANKLASSDALRMAQLPAWCHFCQEAHCSCPSSCVRSAGACPPAPPPLSGCTQPVRSCTGKRPASIQADRQTGASLLLLQPGHSCSCPVLRLQATCSTAACWLPNP